MSKRFHTSLELTLLEIHIGEIIVIADAPFQCARDLLLQWLAARKFGDEIPFAPKTNRFDPGALPFLVSDAPSLKPCMGCFMHDGGGDVFERRRFKENKSLIKDASIEWLVIAGGRVYLEAYPNSLQMLDDPRIVQRIVLFDQLQRVLDAAQARLGLVFDRSHPKAVNVTAC